MPIEEYKKESGAPENNAVIKVVSCQKNTIDADPETADLGGNIAAGFSDEADGGEYSMTCEGMIKSADGRISLTYTEPPFEDEEPSFMDISFAVSDPECITVTRDGEVKTSFVIMSKRRSMSVYSTPFGPLEMCVYGKKVTNTMTDGGGCIEMDYTVELKGMTAQRTHIKITAERR